MLPAAQLRVPVMLRLKKDTAEKLDDLAYEQGLSAVCGARDGDNLAVPARKVPRRTRRFPRGIAPPLK